MTTRQPRWELCKSDAGYWVRFRSSNGQIIVSSETYKRKRDALRAIELVSRQTVTPFGSWPYSLCTPRGLEEVRDLTGDPQ